MPKAEKLSEFQETADQWEDAWAEGQEQGPGGQLPEGEYHTTISVARVQKTSWGEYQLSLRFEDVGGKGGAWLNLALEGSEDRVKFSGAALKKLGYTGPLKDLEDVAGAGTFDDLRCVIAVKDKVVEDKVYHNVYLNECLGPSAPKTGDEDIPF